MEEDGGCQIEIEWQQSVGEPDYDLITASDSWLLPRGGGGPPYGEGGGLNPKLQKLQTPEIN